MRMCELAGAASCDFIWMAGMGRGGWSVWDSECEGGETCEGEGKVCGSRIRTKGGAGVMQDDRAGG